MPLRFLDLPLDILSLLPRYISARDLVRLAHACHQMHGICLTAAGRAIQHIIAAGEGDAPLPISLAPSETVFHRLARLCGVCFAPAAFGRALAFISMQYGQIYWDIAAVEKLHVVLPRCRIEVEPVRRFPSGQIYWRRTAGSATVAEDEEIYHKVISVCYQHLWYARETVVRAAHVDHAISLLWSARGLRGMKRTRALMEEPHDDEEDPDYVPDEEDDGKVELGELVEGGADACGVLIGGTWFPSLAIALRSDLSLEDELVEIYERLHPKGPPLSRFGSYVGQGKSWGCTNPLCCHTRFNCRLISGAMLPQFWPGPAADCPENSIPVSEEVVYEPIHLGRLAHVPDTSRFQPIACPRAKAHHRELARYRMWVRSLQPSMLEEMGISVVEGVRFGDVVDHDDIIEHGWVV